jgi:hypothetical protein
VSFIASDFLPLVLSGYAADKKADPDSIKLLETTSGNTCVMTTISCFVKEITLRHYTGQLL